MTMTADQSPTRRQPTGSGRTRLYPGLAGLLSALLLTACAHVKDEMPRVVPASGDPASVAMPSLPARSPAPCTTTPPEIPATSPAAGNPDDNAAATRTQQYLDSHPEEAGTLVVSGGGIHVGFVAGWCRHQEALRRLVGSGTRVDVFAVVQTYQAGQRLAGRIIADADGLRRAGVRIGATGVDPRTGLTSVTSPDDPVAARAAIVRELGLPANAPIMVSRGDVPIPAGGRPS
jgi:hypothetical protein